MGIAGPVNQNTVVTVNIPHWPVSDGYAIGEICKMDSFLFINDFTAAGYGVSTLTHKDYQIVGSCGDTSRMKEGPHSVKLIVGPGTGLGQGILIKGADENSLYEPYPSEGGHVDFTVKNEDDFNL